MIEPAAVEDIKRVLVEEAKADTVGLWAVVWQVKQDMPSLTRDEVMQITLSVIRAALLGEHIVPGEFVDQDEDTTAFVPWRLSVDETLSRIGQEWTALGRDPNLGDVVWFVDPRLLPVTARTHPMGKGWKP